MTMKNLTPISKITLGKTGEEKAVEYLISKGYEILHRNFRCKLGEIDIVAREIKGRSIVFFEVKTRRNCAFGLPCESITASKLQKIKKITRVYLMMNGLKDENLRIDVIEILIIDGKSYIRHLENV